MHQFVLEAPENRQSKYLSSNEVMVEVMKKSGSGVLLSFIQPPPSLPSAQREEKESDWSSNRETDLKGKKYIFI